MLYANCPLATPWCGSLRLALLPCPKKQLPQASVPVQNSDQTPCSIPIFLLLPCTVPLGSITAHRDHMAWRGIAILQHTGILERSNSPDKAECFNPHNSPNDLWMQLSHGIFVLWHTLQHKMRAQNLETTWNYLHYILFTLNCGIS